MGKWCWLKAREQHFSTLGQILGRGCHEHSLAGSLASPHQMPGAPNPNCDGTECLQTSSNAAKPGSGQNHPRESHCARQLRVPGHQTFMALWAIHAGLLNVHRRQSTCMALPFAFLFSGSLVYLIKSFHLHQTHGHTKVLTQP